MDVGHWQEGRQLRPPQAYFDLRLVLLHRRTVHKLANIGDPVIDAIHSHVHGHGYGVSDAGPGDVERLLEGTSIEARSGPRRFRVNVWPFAYFESFPRLIVNQLVEEESVLVVQE